MPDPVDSAAAPVAAPVAAPSPGRPFKARFVEGSTLRHVAVMTATGSIGLVAVFLVDLLNLFYISLLGEEELAAAIGYAGTVMFFTTSVAIGVMIAGSALVSRAVGGGAPEDGRRLSTSSFVYMALVTTLLAAVMLPLVSPLLTLLGASGRTQELARDFLFIVLPSTPLLGIGMAASGTLRAVGDARRAMWVTLSGGLATAVLDPLLILGLGFGVEGAAIASVIARVVMAAYGLYAVVRVHKLASVPSVAHFLRDVAPLSAIAVPAILTNIATPVGNAYITHALAAHGDAAVAAWAVIGRVIPVAFGPIFALTGAIGPVIGQNVGAQRYDRVRQTVRDSLKLILVYVALVWLLLALARQPLASVFGLSAEGVGLVEFFCLYAAGSFVFIGTLFVANAAFNNLGAPLLSTLFNWGRATLGTVPFVWAGGHWFGATGVLAGQAVGSVAFGIAALICAFAVVGRLHAGLPPRPAAAPLAGAQLPPFSRGEDATAIPAAPLPD
ncbi:MATE family efflux transporter [Ancylobacter amanitiformis]|uniref:MATE family efflux protein n=1 Tax=Ancylobacter amanitiformis TaxID=217069 RepID=A0ABU0LQJ6_9HYPH|nr:MATE family efflux transporter [Ancylobacter amanitiformis]MDQ0510969.1 putative MATE family efflux protein [Ancylobacter amanitiformis]